MPASFKNQSKRLRGLTAHLTLGLLLAATALSGRAYADEAPLKRVAILDFEIIDRTGEAGREQEQAQRLKMITELLRAGFADNGIYSVVDNTPAQSLITDLHQRFELHDCNGCDTDIGAALKADRVVTGWVQKVSNLILNLNIRVRDVKTGEVVLTKSVDIRGNDDKSWSRGIRYIVRSMLEKQQINL